MRTIFDGPPGTRWENTHQRVYYQFIAMLSNTCGVCLQYHMKIGPFWPIPIHHGCNCEQRAIKPGAEAPHDFVDFRELLDAMPHDQQVAAIGASNYRLLKEGVVKWDDIVTPSRIRPLREVVANKKLTVETMTRAGVTLRNAETAFASVHTPEHQLVEQHRRELVERLKDAGVAHDVLTKELATRLAKRISLAAGPDQAWQEQRLSDIETAQVGETKRLLKALKPAVSMAMARKPAPPNPTAGPPAPASPPSSPPPQPMASNPPGQPVLPGRPIHERLAAWTEGDDKVRAIQDLAHREPTAQEVYDAHEAVARFLKSHSARAIRASKTLKAERKALEARAKDLHEWRFDPNRKAREVLPGIIKPGNPPRWSNWGRAKLPPGLGKEVDAGHDFIHGVLHDPGHPIRLEWKAHPGKYRANAPNGIVNLAESDLARTVVHELGHIIEDQIKGAVQAAKAFLTHRAKGEKPQNFKTLFPAENFESWEEGIENEFGRYFHPKNCGGAFTASAARYVGKHYPNDTEVISMGLEALFQNPVGFAAKDPEFCKFILGILGGELR